MKKLAYGILILAILVGGYAFFVGAPDNERLSLSREYGQYDTDDYFYEDEYDEGASGDEGFVIETEVDGPEDCVEIETYDAQRGVCFVECDTEAQCDAIEEQIDAALDEFGDEYADFAKNLKPFEGEASELEENAEVVYKIEKGEKFTVVSGVENENHKKVKKWLAAISPNKFSDIYLSRLIPYTKPGADTMAYVTPNQNEPGKWDMYVNMDTMKDGIKEMVFTLIHEYMHIVTLNSSQVSEQTPEEDCGTYFVQEGCTSEKSYLNNFYNKFWRGKFNPQAEDPIENFEGGGKSVFINEYAATNPGEDIAESFASFVLKKDKKTGTVAEQKVAFFYNYPELVKIRSAIRNSLKSIVRERIKTQR